MHLSGFTTQPEEDQVALVAAAGDRIRHYIPTGRGSDEAKLAPCLRAFVKFLPEEGAVSVARDVIACHSDDDLYQNFNNLCTALIYPSKFIHHILAMKTNSLHSEGFASFRNSLFPSPQETVTDGLDGSTTAFSQPRDPITAPGLFVERWPPLCCLWASGSTRVENPRTAGE